VYSVRDGVKHYFGFVDIMDVLYSYLQNKDGAHHRIVADIINLSGRNPWLSLHCQDSLQHACTVLSGTNTTDSVHRCAVFEENLETKQDCFFSVLSQSKIVQYISEHISQYPIAKITVTEIKLGFRDVLTIDVNKTVLEALSLLTNFKISGIAVTQHDKIIGNISASDLSDIYRLPKGLSEVLNSPISEYFAGKRSVPIFIHPNEATLESVYKLVVQEKIHRVYLVEEEKLVGIITLSDLLALWAVHTHSV